MLKLTFAYAVTSLVLMAQGPVRFNRDIRPIMSDTCLRCHGPDKNARIAGMRLDIREEALRAAPLGTIPIVPGDPDKSAIVQRIFADKPARRMPPPSIHKDLTAAQKELFRRWVAEGAKYEGHWSFEPIKRPAAPEVSANAGPARNPIDAFIQARLAKEGLQPSPEADRRTLIRRVALDVTGLPPTPAEVEAFVQDSTPDAYQKLVDRLLASPHYAEMQALHWLDAVRYADTSGFHGDNPFPAWPYRDYVLRAFRENKPFDQFTREQLGGDLLPNATVEQKVASAYNRMNRTSGEGGLQPKEYLAKYGSDRVRTLSAVWLGATMGCAECHDHKFDPFTARDFYSMKAFFADIDETGLVPDRGANAWGKKLTLPTDEQARQLAELDLRIDAAKKALAQKTESLASRPEEWEKQVLQRFDSGALAWRYPRPIAAESEHGTKLTIYDDELLDSTFFTSSTGGSTLISERKRGNGVIVASGPNPDNETFTVRVQPGEGTWTALGINALQDETLPGLPTEVEAELSSGAAAPRKLSFVLASIYDDKGQTVGYPPMATIDGNPRTGWAVPGTDARDPFLALRFAEPVKTGADSILTVRLHHDSDFRKAVIGRLRLALSAAQYSWPEQGDSGLKTKVAKDSPNATLTMDVERGLPPEVVEALRIPGPKRTEAQQKSVLAQFTWATPELEADNAALAKLETARNLLVGSIPEVVYTVTTTPRETRILARGNFMDESSPVVEPAIPGFLGKLSTGGRRANRLDLANWLVSEQNPLTARAFVNRQWRQFFGTGISKILEDLGSQGEWPVNSELLDWLASEFMHPEWQADGAHPWDVRHIVRTIVLSQTYRQSSRTTPQLNERDPDNRLLARQSRFRVDAEVVRDIALAVSGLLSERFGGPSVGPYEPEGYLSAMNFPKREFSASRSPDLYRRGIYTQWQRTFLHPSLLAFDAPSREECTVNRTTSNTPLQALVLLNDPIYVEASRVFAVNILRQGGTLDQQLDWAYQRALGRKPSAEERKILADLDRTNLARFQSAPEAAQRLLAVGDAPVPAEMKPADLAAMTTVARAIFNLHETITRN